MPAPTPPGFSVSAPRDRFADLLRTLALGAVILGHWTMAAIGRSSAGELTVDNILNIERWMWPITWVLVMIPLFFFVGGFSNATSWNRVVERERTRRGDVPPTFGQAYRVFVHRRLGGLFTPLIPFVLLVAVAVALALWLGAPKTLTLTVAVVVVMPLWFIAVFAALALIAPVMLVLHERFGWWVVAALSLAAVAVDVVRIVTDNPYPGYLNYVLVWGVAQQIGFAYFDGTLQRMSRTRVAAWAAVAFAALVAATASSIWPESMIGLSGERSNFSPPGTVPLLLTLVQIPVALLLRPVVAPWLDRPRVAAVLDTASNNSMRAFLWHLPVLVAVTGLLLLAGVPFPDPGSAAWWWSRLLWFPLLALALWGLLATTDALRRRRLPRAGSR
ncbi:Acyltransferase family protein [Sanguibacter gelidistatuariae]|uniref:Acyltransferase family protein n=1 Tax=Sanguibacter gelidistatuariae TaxID=1814289 RepID=A0A1G6HAX4_9MICO|nr:acyltransferase family protein [Sanguibacter gelidistatuariae]SDB91447.1 Acyltransferase family protein [Sanguibacter gelidistatuariae]